MTDEIIKIRERLVELSKDPIETRELLDKLTYEEIAQHDLESAIHVGKNEVTETRDFEYGSISKTRTGYWFHLKGGYDVFVDNKMVGPALHLQFLLDKDSDAKSMSDEDKAAHNYTMLLIEYCFRIPQLIMSAPATQSEVFTMDAIGQVIAKYLEYITKIGEVPIEETDNPEYDKAMAMITEVVENLTKGLEKEGKEFERRMGYAESKEESKSQDKGEIEAEFQHEGKE